MLRSTPFLRLLRWLCLPLLITTPLSTADAGDIGSLTCDAVPGGGLIDLSWEALIAVDSYQVIIDGSVVDIVPGPFAAGAAVAYSSAPVPLQQQLRCGVRGVVDSVLGSTSHCQVGVWTLPAESVCVTPQLPVDDSAATSSTLQIATLTPLLDVQIDLSLTHAAVDQLDVSLQSPAGTTIFLHSSVASATPDLELTYWGQGQFAAPPFSGGVVQRATGPGALADFIGETSAGTWTLTVFDDTPSVDGVLEEWCVRTFDTPPYVAYGADVTLGELDQFTQAGRLGDEVGAAIDTPACNTGTTPLDWFVNPNPQHPFQTFNLYRLEGGTFEQIAQSWVKHGFGAAQFDECGFGCTPHPDSTRLGVGCSDTYGAALNAQQSILGPRSEIDPWSGSFDFFSSHIATTFGPHDAVEHRLRIADDDLDPTLHPTAQYFCEVYLVAHDDVDHRNSLVWEPVQISGAPGGTWDFDISGAGTQVGVALAAWPQSQLTAIPRFPTEDGRCYLATRVDPTGTGRWRYQYALFNLDLNQQVGTFQVPLPATSSITAVEFSAPASFGEPYDNEPWQAQRDASGLTWATDPAAAATPQNPLRWGSLYCFRFEADSPPMPGEVTLLTHEAGPLLALSGLAQIPSAPAVSGEFVRGDGNSDGTISTSDAIVLLTFLFSGASAPACFDAADFDDSGHLALVDAVSLLVYLFSQGSPPALPFPGCGPDPTADPLICSGQPNCP